MTKQKTRPSADSTRSAILTAARDLFVKKGFAATSISEIAKLAKINQSLIYHHFKNKEDLWGSVKDSAKEAYESYKHLDINDCLKLESAKEYLIAIITYRFDIFDMHPEIRRMIDWQYLETSPEKLIGIQHINVLKKRLQHFQNQGEIISSYDPDLLLTYILNAPLGFWKSYKDLEKAVPKDQLEHYKAQYCQLCVDSLIQGFILK